MARSRSDSNAREIVDNIRAQPGFSAHYTAGLKAGFPDLMVGHIVNGKRYWHAVELKRLGGLLRASQYDFILKAYGCVHVATSSFEVFALIKECEGLP